MSAPGATAFWALQLAGWSLYAAAKAFAYPIGALDGAWIALKGIALSSLLAWVLHRLAHGRSGRLWRLPLALALALPLALISLALSRSLVPAGFVLQAPGTLQWLDSARGLLLETLLFQAWGLLFLGAGYAIELRTALAQMRTARDRLLRWQLRPHLLLNALASLRALLPRDAGRARDALDDLAGYLHHALRASESDSASLAQEFEGLRHFLALQKLRFDARLDYELALDPAVSEVRIPPLLLQPLVENAVRHGLRDAAQGQARIAVRAQRARGRCVLEVSNSGIWQAAEDSTRTRPALGLHSVRCRLQEAFGSAHAFTIGPVPEGVRARLEFDAA